VKFTQVQYKFSQSWYFVSLPLQPLHSFNWHKKDSLLSMLIQNITFSEVYSGITCSSDSIRTAFE